ncbi:MAG: thiosulfate oxidation carrier complex protein SoxZ [Gammaproteobacteria bacterium]|nr:thiosulfate oxidation carrier complex protein SoxZ [Gammaproteobacteria bacterium]
MAGKVKIRAKLKKGVAVVKSLMSHPMETGNRKDKKTGKKIPEHFIEVVDCQHNGETVLTAHLGASVSKNPYLSFEFTGANKGDTVKISWVDNKGETGSGEAKIK